MKIDIDEILKEIGSITKSVIENFNKLDTNDKIELLNRLKDFQKKQKQKQNRIELAELVYISVHKAAKKLDVTEQTIYNRINAGVLPAKRFGKGNYRINIKDLFNFATSLKGIEEIDYAYCLSDNIYIDIKRKNFLPFEKRKKYQILRSNKIWIYLYNPDFEDDIKIGCKHFREHFITKEDERYDVYLEADDYNV